MMITNINEAHRIEVVEALMASGAIRFRTPEGPNQLPVTFNFARKESPRGVLSDSEVAQMAELMAESHHDLCTGCEAVVGIPQPYYSSRRGQAGSPLEIAFAQKNNGGITPVGLHEIRKGSSFKKVLVIDTFLGDPDPMHELVESLCGLQMQVVGAISFVGREKKLPNGSPWRAVFTPLGVVEFCQRHGIVPWQHRLAVKSYLGGQKSHRQ